MANRFRDIVLIVTVLAALFLTGSALYGLGRRVPPPPEVHPTPVTHAAPETWHLR
jgi:hypothetical protein